MNEVGVGISLPHRRVQYQVSSGAAENMNWKEAAKKSGVTRLALDLFWLSRANITGLDLGSHLGQLITGMKFYHNVMERRPEKGSVITHMGECSTV